MLKSIRFGTLLLAIVSFQDQLDAREWTDVSGKVKIQGTMLAADHKEVVIKLDEKRENHELLAIAIEDLSQADQDYIHSEEAMENLRSEGEKQVWELKNGMKVFGQIVSFGKKDLSLQRRRGKLYANNRPVENLPEIYQKMIPAIVAHFEDTTFEGKADFDKWVIAQKANVRTFPCEGVVIAFPNGDEYAVPLFFLSAKTMAALQPSYQAWSDQQNANAAAEQDLIEHRREQELYLQSQAASMRNQQEMMRIAKLQLVTNSVGAGITDLWEVMLYPPTGVPGYPITVVVPSRDSRSASVIAMQRNPGFVAGPVRKLAGN